LGFDHYFNTNKTPTDPSPRPRRQQIDGFPTRSPVPQLASQASGTVVRLGWEGIHLCISWLFIAGISRRDLVTKRERYVFIVACIDHVNDLLHSFIVIDKPVFVSSLL
jgi:hypothetical protein